MPKGSKGRLAPWLIGRPVTRIFSPHQSRHSRHSSVLTPLQLTTARRNAGLKGKNQRFWVKNTQNQVKTHQIHTAGDQNGYYPAARERAG
jgi:hypothetical protein